MRRRPPTSRARADILSVHLALGPETRNLVNAGLLCEAEARRRSCSTPRAARSWMQRRSRRRCRSEAFASGLDVYAQEPASATGSFSDPLVALPGVYGTHHIGASTDQAQEAIAAETVRIVKSYKETGRVPNVVNLARRTPATHMLVVRHRDRPGVLAHVFDHLRRGNLNVQETENIVFEGAEAAVARINLDGEPSAGDLRANQSTETPIFWICNSSGVVTTSAS